MNAVIGLHPDIIRMLISHGADPNICGGASVKPSHEHIHLTPLQWAVKQCAVHPEQAKCCIVEILKSSKLLKNKHSNEGEQGWVGPL